jgi:RNA polymerase sigma-70 factor (ECF subfamily)
MTDGEIGRLSAREEQELVARMKQGDPTALERLWRAYAQTVYACAIYPSLPIRDLAEEVLQNTFLKAFERIEGYTWQERGILPWLKTIARNLATDVHRRHQRADRFCKGYGRYVEAMEEVGVAQDRPDQRLAERQEAELVRQRVRAVLESGQLNERYHAAIELRLFQELEREVCAERMGVKLGTFDVLMHRALKRFEAIYREMFGGGEDDDARGGREP